MDKSRSSFVHFCPFGTPKRGPLVFTTEFTEDTEREMRNDEWSYFHHNGTTSTTASLVVKEQWHPIQRGALVLSRYDVGNSIGIFGRVVSRRDGRDGGDSRVFFAGEEGKSGKGRGGKKCCSFADEGG